MLTCSFCTRVLPPDARVCPTCGVEVGSAPVPPVRPVEPLPTRAPRPAIPAAAVAPAPLSRPTPPVAPLPSQPTEIPGLPSITVFGATTPLLVQPDTAAPDADAPDAAPDAAPEPATSPAPSPDGTPRSERPRTSRRTIVTSVALAGVLFVVGVVGWSNLAGRITGDTSAVTALPVPGTDLVVDKPEGWATRDLVNASPVIGGLIDGGQGGAPRGELFARDGTSMFVVAQPNSLGLTEFPEVPSDLGDLRVTAQAPVALPVGSGREIDALGSGRIDGQRVRATFVPAGPYVVVIGALGGTDVTPEDDAAYRALVASLRPAAPPS